MHGEEEGELTLPPPAVKELHPGRDAYVQTGSVVCFRQNRDGRRERRWRERTTVGCGQQSRMQQLLEHKVCIIYHNLRGRAGLSSFGILIEGKEEEEEEAIIGVKGPKVLHASAIGL